MNTALYDHSTVMLLISGRIVGWLVTQPEELMIWKQATCEMTNKTDITRRHALEAIIELAERRDSTQ